MTALNKNSLIIAAAFLLFSMMVLIMPYQQQQQSHLVYAGRTCIDYDQTENTITITCDTSSSFRDVADTINDQAILSNLGNGEYLLNANLQVDDDTTFSMSQNDDGITWLKIAGANGIIVDGKIEIDGVKITSWDTQTDSPVSQNSLGTIPRAYINLRGSDSSGGGGFVRNSEIAYLGYQDFGKRGFDLFGGNGHTHDFEIRDSKFHDMWFAFYSRGA